MSMLFGHSVIPMLCYQGGKMQSSKLDWICRGKF